MNKRFLSALGACMLLGTATPASAMTFLNQSFVCPIGGETFQQRMAGSGTVFGSELDTRPYGAIESPWPLPQCPSNGFVMFKQTFTPSEIETLTPVVASEDYQGLRRTDTSYFMAAQLMAALGADHRQLAYILLKASWQGDAAQAQRYRALVLQHLEQQESPPKDPELEVTDQLVAGEMERRLGRFEQAERRFRALKRRPEGPQSSLVDRIATYQLQLIKAKDRQAHQVPPDKALPPREPLILPH